MLSDERLREIQKRCNDATGGPWRVEGFSVVTDAEFDNMHHIAKVEQHYVSGVFLNIHLIAHSRQDIPDLLEELKFFKSVVADMQEESDKIRLYTKAKRENKALREFLKEVHKLVPQAVEMIARRSDREEVVWLSNLS